MPQCTFSKSSTLTAFIASRKKRKLKLKIPKQVRKSRLKRGISLRAARAITNYLEKKIVPDGSLVAPMKSVQYNCHILEKTRQLLSTCVYLNACVNFCYLTETKAFISYIKVYYCTHIGDTVCLQGFGSFIHPIKETLSGKKHKT